MDGDQEEKPTWGCHFNSEFSWQYKKQQRPAGCPDWANPSNIEAWSKRGFVIWSDISRKVMGLSAIQAVELLQKLETSEEWKTTGIAVREQYNVLRASPSKRSSKKKTKGSKAGEDAPEEPVTPLVETGARLVEREVLRLPVEAGPEVLQQLQSRRPQLEQMAEAERKRIEQALDQVYDVLFRSWVRTEIRKLDLPNRAFPWVPGNKPDEWVCEQPPDRAVVSLSHTFLLTACITHKGQYWKSKVFVPAEEAFPWAENELMQLKDVVDEPDIPDDEKEREIACSRLLERLAADPTAIRGEQMEPETIHYQVFIEVDVKADSSKTFEHPCGDPFVYERQYPSNLKMAKLLELDPDHYTIQPEGNFHYGWYWFHSVVNYHLDTLVIMQAQKAWDSSKILREYKNGKVIRARYGYQEKETGHIVILGSCDHPDKPWRRLPTRAEHLADLAARETLFLRLALDDFRVLAGLSARTISDADLLYALHQNRAESRFTSEEARQESRIWMAEHSGERNNSRR